MSAELQKSSGAAVRPVDYLAFVQAENPLKLLPPEVRPAVVKLWVCNHHLFPTALALAASVSVALAETSVTFDNVTAICAALLHPARRSKIKFAADLIAEFSRLVDECAKRNTAAKANAEYAKAPLVKLKLGELFKTPD